MRSIVFLVVQLAAFWPIWRWYGARTITQSGNGYALLALGTAMALLGWKGRQLKQTVPYPLATVLTIVYAIMYLVAPIELFAPIAFLALALLLGGNRLNKGELIALSGLFFLSMPMIPWLNFYVGYPLRLLVTQLVSPLLHLSGLMVSIEGTNLLWNTKTVSIDAPCSGIKMLWTGGYLLCTLALIFQLAPRRFVAAGVLTAVMVLAANVLRASALFYLEAGIIDMGIVQHTVNADTAHDAVGSGVFAAAALATYLLVRRLARGGRTLVSTHQKKYSGRMMRGMGYGWLGACVLAALVPTIHMRTDRAPSSPSFPGWPTTLEGKSLQRVSLAAKEIQFNQQFPGRVARFTDGEHEIIMRWITTPSRMVHSAAHCLGANGWTIHSLPLYTDENGREWRHYDAQKENVVLETREIFMGTDDTHQSDVSSWYWSGMLGKSQGPWWHISITRRRTQ